MSDKAKWIIQELRNRVDTQSHGWAAFKDASTIGYLDAYNNHKEALSAVDENLKLDNKRCWMVFTLFWTVGFAGLAPVGESLGEWAGRLIEDAEKAEDVASELFDKTRDLMSEDAKDLIKESLFEDKAEKGKKEHPWEPVADSPEKYQARMGLMLDKLAQQILKPLDQLITRAESWESWEAEAWAKEFEASCPYMTDLPDDLETTFQGNVQETAEWTMWVEWALVRDQPWWKKYNERVSDGNGMLPYQPILQRLEELHVPLNEVSTVTRVGDGFFNRGFRVLDMDKFINWARRNKPIRSSLTKEQLRKAHDLLVPQLHAQDQFVCRKQL
jgi:hypothetical protein